jgi:pimeloyl-ACP methyl ester carboxylesterase
MGGRSTSFAAAHHADRVAGLVLVDYTPDNAPSGSQRVAKTVVGAPDVFESVAAAMRYFSVDPHSPAGAAKRERFEAYLRAVAGGYAIKRDPHFANQFRRLLETGERPKLGVDMWQVVAEVPCPILALRGTRSDMFAAETKPKLLSANPRAQLAEIDAGHNIGGENPEGLLAAVRPFLASLEKSHEQAA